MYTPKKYPKDRTIEVELMLGITGWITVELIDAKTGVVKRRLKFPNLITDVGVNRIMGGLTTLNAFVFGSGLATYCAMGTGATTPAVTDTTLVAEITPSTTHRTNSTGGYAETSAYVSGPPDYHFRSRTFYFVEAQANGNLTEVGLFDASSGGNMWMRQLLKDVTGTPTTVVKTSAETLRVIYELRVQPPQSDHVATGVSISGTNYDITTRPKDASTVSVWGSIGLLIQLGNFTSGNAKAFETQTLSSRTGTGPTGTVGNSSSIVWSAYGSGNFYRDVTIKWEPAVANFATGIGSATFHEVSSGGNHYFQQSYTPKFAKDNTMRLTLVERVAFTRL